MNICLFNRLFEQYRGGIETYTHRMTKAYAECGHTVHIVTTRGDKKHQFPGLESRVHVHYVDYEHKGFPGFWRINNFIPLEAMAYHKKADQLMKEIIAEYEIDVVEIPDFDGYFPIKNRNFPLVVRLHGYHGMINKFGDAFCRQRPSQYLLRNRIKEFCNSAEYISAVSQNFANLFADIIGVNLKNQVVTNLAVDHMLFTSANFNERSKNTVLFVGRLEESKGIEVIIQAIPKIYQKIPNVKFILVGRDRKKNGTNLTYKEYIKKNFDGCNIEFVDSIPQKEVAEHFRTATMAVFPSLFEPGGTVAIEAISCGCPAIVSDVGGFNEYFFNEQNGLVVPPNDAVALANAVIKLFEDEKLRRKLCQDGIHVAESQFSLNKIVRESIQVYQNTIDKFKKEELRPQWQEIKK